MCKQTLQCNAHIPVNQNKSGLEKIKKKWETLLGKCILKNLSKSCKDFDFNAELGRENHCGKH